MQNDPEKASLLAHLLADRRYAAMLGLGFSAGIPYLLVYVTQSAWLSEAKVPIETIGLMSELTIAYKFKFVWAPFLDKYDAPIFSALLGRRRGWIVVSQLGYRVGTLAAGAGALLLADRYGWRSAYLCMAALMTVGAISAFVAPEPESDFTASHQHPGFVVAVVAPIKEMVTRLGPLALQSS